MIKKINGDLKLLIATTVVSIVVLVLASFLMGGSSESPKGAQASVDTFIPKGHVLVPLEIENYDALDSILGKFGTVDLFRSKESGGGLIARNVRILRAPQNPSRFAVLVRETESRPILEAQVGGIFAVVRRPSTDGTEFVNTPTQRSRIVFEGE